ncbi:MAG: nucleotide pyrophosphohydrolase [Muribaculaceae bacterium]|nr:nucleotide pyrophosphohydrolase [Muribaculaceae bacterium]
MNPSPTLQEIQSIVDGWIKAHGGYFSPLTNLAMLAEEVGELARVMARTYGDQVAKPGDERDISEEIADILWVLTAIANQTGTSLTESFSRTIQKKTVRDAKRFTSKTDKNLE